MIKLLLLGIIILFFLWLIFNLFSNERSELNKKIKFSKPYIFLIFIIFSVLLIFILNRIGLNPFIILQKILPFLGYLKGIIPF